MKRYNITVNGNTYDVIVEEADASEVSAPVAAPVAAPAAPAAKEGKKFVKRIPRRKVCAFCQDKNFKGIDYKDANKLKKYVTEKNGVKYYNDSKGTNPDAAIQGIKAMITKTILIGGGYDKGSEYDQWIEAFEGKVKLLVLLGQTSEKIAKTAREHGFEDIVMVSSLEEAVKVCTEHAEPGEAVLLSPACASWGMFKNYEERGNKFKDLVRAL